jgi:hypothetical protein
MSDINLNTPAEEESSPELMIAIQLREREWDNLIEILGELPAKFSAQYITYFVMTKKESIAKYRAGLADASTQVEEADNNSDSQEKVEDETPLPEANQEI